ncbi:outer membrane beta-barrel protein [Cecembia rubra]|uniref:Outer membrane protein with beta-barrel domain n=1 Tax=Cecembia rubra TaxID=1485585 RepID=A0A2P8EAP9_9BACT|nr:outer membrane beta-barrel protein [Cecembia rubra]PSL06553.1 outer membrane protein with beta-barrel domain [Cecembia rubra]
MKKLVFILFALSIFSNVYAQKNLNFDLAFGANYPRFTDLPFDYKGDFGFNGTLRMWYNISDEFSIGVETNYMQLNHSNNDGAFLKSHYIGLPLLVKRTFPSNLYVAVGVGYLGLAASEEVSFRTEVAGSSIPAPFSELQGFIYLPATLGYNISKGLFVEINSLWGLSNMSKTYEYKASPIALSLGFRL